MIKKKFFLIFGILFFKQFANCFINKPTDLSKKTYQTNIGKNYQSTQNIYNVRECVLICAKCFRNDLKFFGQEVNYALNAFNLEY